MLPTPWASRSSLLRLVILATLLSIVIGVIVGIDRDSPVLGIDYVTTFLAFVPSPSFLWLAVLLKEWCDPLQRLIASGRISTTAIILISIGLGLALQFIMGGQLSGACLLAAWPQW